MINLPFELVCGQPRPEFHSEKFQWYFLNSSIFIVSQVQVFRCILLDTQDILHMG